MSFLLLVNNLLSSATSYWIARDYSVRQRGIISPIVQGVSFTQVTVSSSQAGTGEGAPTADTDEESNIIKVHQIFTCVSLPNQTACTVSSKKYCQKLNC